MGNLLEELLAALVRFTVSKDENSCLREFENGVAYTITPVAYTTKATIPAAMRD